MFFRSSKNDLPIASTSYSGADGSGKAIHMDAPIVRAWKNASVGTKATYYSLLACLVLMYVGYRNLRYNHASIWLTCHAKECTLHITPQGRQGTTTVNFPRKQLVRSQAVKVNKLGKFVQIDYSRDSYNYNAGATNRKYKKKRPYNAKGPDRNGHYDSYTVHLKPPGIVGSNADFVDLSSIKDYIYESDVGDYVLQMRQFNLGQSRRRTRTLVTKVESYIRERRHKLTLKENASLSWKGILALVLGLFGVLMTVLIGQFVDEHPAHHGGPGARARLKRHHQEQQARGRTGQQQPPPPRASNRSVRYRPASSTRDKRY